MAMGCQWMVGMAFIAAHAMECFPFLNCATCVWWHVAQVSGVGIFTLATSLAEVCWSPWQATQVTSIWLCLLNLQSETMLGVTLLWQSMHCVAGASAAAANRGEMKRKRGMAQIGRRFIMPP